jgi:hypothetical protein
MAILLQEFSMEIYTPILVIVPPIYFCYNSLPDPHKADGSKVFRPAMDSSGEQHQPTTR